MATIDSLESQLCQLEEERKKGQEELLILEGAKNDGMKINLIPAIKHQRKANVSMKHAVKKVVKFRKQLAEVRHIISENRLQSTDPVPGTTIHTSDTVPYKRYDNGGAIDDVTQPLHLLFQQEEEENGTPRPYYEDEAKKNYN